MSAPATGFAVNVDAVASAVDAPVPAADVIVFGEEGAEMKAIEYIRSLASQGIRAEFSVFDTKEDTAAYAREKRISKLVTVGDTVTEEVF